MELSSKSQLPLFMLAFLPSPVWTLLLLLACHWPPPHSISWFKKKTATPTLSPGPHFCNCLAPPPPFSPLTNYITPPNPPVKTPVPDTNTHPASPPPKTAASRHWAGPPHLLGEVHPQCGKSFGAGADHITNHTGWLTISGFCNCNHITLCYGSLYM